MLWHNETRFRRDEAACKALLGAHASEETIDQMLYRHEIRNIQFFGYGSKRSHYRWLRPRLISPGRRFLLRKFRRLSSSVTRLLMSLWRCSTELRMCWNHCAPTSG
ncbi:MAG: hypothetical protein M2R45_05272 [Verrucomicrobia subdivision 3 bacterium]|nr:hypothetical protein [Limisphaerales bacterium]MCS1417470.1 hypothetical protein [Limisphaerales bacterium]